MVKNLKSLRTQAGISQQTLATAIGISQQSVNKYENHSIEPDIATLIAMADYFETTVDYLIGRTNESDNNVRLSGTTNLEVRYRRLNERERMCVDTVLNTLCERRHIK